MIFVFLWHETKLILRHIAWWLANGNHKGGNTYLQNERTISFDIKHVFDLTGTFWFISATSSSKYICEKDHWLSPIWKAYMQWCIWIWCLFAGNQTFSWWRAEIIFPIFSKIVTFLWAVINPPKFIRINPSWELKYDSSSYHFLKKLQL